MAEVVPFEGVLYNQARITSVADVVAPPYDVISEEKQDVLHDRHPQNVIRLILGKKKESDTDSDNPHTRAAGSFNSWLEENVLSQDASEAFYLTSVSFDAGDGKETVRYGLIARVGLEPFEKGVILPHEKTFSKVKSERLSLMKKCKANFSQIFSLYPDQGGILKALIDAVRDISPDIDLVDDAGERHKLWRITDTGVCSFVSEAMKGQKLYIADGHHRYETALNYREWLRENEPGFSPDHPANYIMMYLCSMEDPGLVIFPTHRMLTEIDAQGEAEFFNRAEKWFDVKTLPFSSDDLDKGISVLNECMAEDVPAVRIGVVFKGRSEFGVLTLKEGVAESLLGGDIHKSLQELDVTVLTHIVFKEILGIDPARLDDEKLIAYTSSEKEAVHSAVSGRCPVSFIINSTKIEQVRDIAEAGEVMPRKTTYFYPKALTGLVFNKLTR